MTNKHYPLYRLLCGWLVLMLFAGASPAYEQADELVEQATSNQSKDLAATNDAARTQLQALQFPADAPVKFTETLYNPMLAEPVQSAGTVWLEADGAMLMEVQTPRRELRRLHNNRLTLTRAQSTTASEPSKAPRQRALRLRPNRSAHMILLAASALLQGQHDWLLERFTLSLATFDSDAEQDAAVNWELLLVPSNAKLRAELPWIRLRGAGSELRSLRADRSAKGWQQFEFSSIVN